MAAANVEALYRLSPVQEGMLYHWLEHGGHDQGRGDGTYLVQYQCVLSGVDKDCLEKAWTQCAQRHPVLRTLFTWERRARPLQLVRQRVELRVERHDWQGLPATEQDRRWHSYAQRDRDRGFDLERAPLMRLALLDLDDTRSRFLWTFHHLLLDGWSMRLVLHDVMRLYAALRQGKDAALPPARPYADFIAWLEQRDTTGEEAFWREYLRGFDTPTTLDLPRDETGTTRSTAVRERVLDAACMKALTRQAQAERITVSILVLAAWSLVLGRHACSDDVVFGTTVSGRPAELPGIESMAGLFINTLPLRVRVRPDAPLREWLLEVQRQQRALLAHEHSPLVSVKRCSELPPGTPLFESLVGYQNVPGKAEDAARDAALVTTEERYVEYSNYPLALLVLPGATLTLEMVYDPARFGGAAVDRLLAQVGGLLETMSASLDGPVRDLPVLPPAELAQVLPAAGATDFGPPRCVHGLIEAQAVRAPEATAAIDEHGALGYGELLSRTSRLAGLLRARGVTPQTPVPVLAGRTRAAIVAMVGVLRAGGAYVPLDPGWPASRVARILDDLGAQKPLPAILCEADCRDTLGPRAGVAVSIDEPDDAPAGQEPDTAGVPAADPAQLAYVIYTSGSTGQPKGVMVSHANLFNSVRAREVFYPHPPGVFLLLSPLATDSSIAGLFWTLCTGGALLLPAHRAEQDPDALSEFVAAHRATHTLCLPSLYQALLESTDPARLASLDTVIVAGEACAPGVVARHHQALPAARLYNEYGPSGATVWATATELGAQPAHGFVPLGEPVANTRVYVLDDALRPVPLGAAGELCIGGANVARGYHGQPERTAERFVTDPFDPSPGARLYRTGDRVRRHEDGALEFLGRVDNQIKIRGYRVEPEEIEAALNSHPDVAESVVGFAAAGVATDTGSGSLVAALQQLDEKQVETLLAAVEKLSPAEVDARLEQVSRSPDARRARLAR